jgi:hypothetical protein
MAKLHDAVEMRAADSDSSLDGFHGSSEDAKDMYRLGRSQELKVCCVAQRNLVEFWKNTDLLATEKLSFRSYSRPDMCYYVYLDGHPVVSPLARGLIGAVLMNQKYQHLLSD